MTGAAAPRRALYVRAVAVLIGLAALVASAVYLFWEMEKALPPPPA